LQLRLNKDRQGENGNHSHQRQARQEWESFSSKENEQEWESFSGRQNENQNQNHFQKVRQIA
jgi:hypothetical protein